MFFLYILFAIIVFPFAVLSRFSAKRKSPVLKAVFFAVCIAVVYYLTYPAINIHSFDFWGFCMFTVILGLLLFVPQTDKEKQHVKNKKTQFDPAFTDGPFAGIRRKKLKKQFSELGPAPAIIGFLVFVFAIRLIAGIIFSPVFMSDAYAHRIGVSEVSFSEIPAYQFNQTAIIDRSSASLLGDKEMGQMTDLVSQFSVSSEYNQISYKNGTTRVTPLAYDGIVKYFRNHKQGVPAYITVSTTTGAIELVRLTEKMHYVPSAYFNENLYRHLRFKFPTVLFGDPSFEIDDEGHPYYVCTTYTYTGIQSMHKVTGVILLDPCSGKAEKYDLGNVPEWVDRVFPEDLVIEELNDYGRYAKGWLNSWIGQEGVIQTSEGYNYLSKDGDIWLYTGMTSVGSDESNIGFMLVNLRTHEAQYTASSVASEVSAMASAEGEVLNYGYTATFPTLINVSGKPMYLLSLKDSAGLVKIYAIVDAKDYQQVYTAKAEKNTQSAISTLIKMAGGKAQPDAENTTEIFIDELKTAIIDGNTIMYIKADGAVYRLVVTEVNAKDALFLEEGDRIGISFSEGNSGVFDIIEITAPGSAPEDSTGLKDIVWIRNTDVDEEHLVMFSDGSWSYSEIGAGNPADDADLYPTYSFDEETNTIVLADEEGNTEGTPVYTVVSVDAETLVIKTASGELRTFTNGGSVE